MDDGSPPGRTVLIQRNCNGAPYPFREGYASPKTGDYTVRLEVADFGGVFSGAFESTGLLPCVLEAVAQGVVSTKLDLSDRRLTMNPELPLIVLTRVLPGSAIDLKHGPAVPRPVSKKWMQGVKLANAKDWAGAETAFRTVVQAAPKFAPGWNALGMACLNLNKAADARDALQQAVELDPKPLPPYVSLTNAELGLKDWDAAAKTSQTLIQADTKHLYLEAYFQQAVARYQLGDFDRAQASVVEGMRLDRLQDLPRAEYVLGLILEAKHDLDAAAQHIRSYLEKHPRAEDAAEATERLNNLGKQPPADLSRAVTAADMRLPATGEIPVPGGLDAFSQIARLKQTPANRDFFLEYCRAITGGGEGASQTAEARMVVRAYLASVAELEQLGEPSGGGTTIRISLRTDEARKKAEHVLGLLGWKLVQNGEPLTGGNWQPTLSVEPGGTSVDGRRQRIPQAFGIDELEMREALEGGRDYQFEIPTGSARLIGGAAWSVLLKGAVEFPGGPLEIFISDLRFARAYSGLGVMEPDAAAAVVSSEGLGNLIVKHSNLLADYGAAFAVASQRVIVPGGAKAEAVWAKLAGANPQNPARFFRALLEKDQGHSLPFYFDLWRADAAHQQFFTASAARLEGAYRWYRDSVGVAGLAAPPERWQAVILQRLRLSSSGEVEFPGGAEAWVAGSASPADALLRLTALPALAALIQLEEKRKAPLDRASAELLREHYGEWRSLFPYFEQLPGLGAAEFEALAKFADSAAGAPAERQKLLVGDWHSLVELIVLANQAGSLDAARSAAAFRQVCEALQSENPSARSIEALRGMTSGAADIDEALASGLLRLNGAKRDAFERVKALQNVPRIGSLGQPPDALKTLAALSGAVYAALLDPKWLLVAEDPLLLSKHNFVPAAGDQRTSFFAPSSMIVSNGPPGSLLLGGFGTFGEVARPLSSRVISEKEPERLVETAALMPPGASDGGIPSMTPPPSTDAVFRASGRIVEVYATVTDGRGRYVDDLRAPQFTILEEGHPKPVFAFENHTSSVTVALLFDTTGSMEEALPPLKNAALRLLDDLRPDDTVAVYGFNDRVTELQEFTKDKVAAKRAVLRAHASGTTALYDALVSVIHDLSGRSGKKVIIVFTDGDDNASMLTSDTAVMRAKSRGIPIHTIAEGQALTNQTLIGELANVSHATGGTPFLIRTLADIGGVFQKVSEDLMHGYLLAFQPEPGEDRKWRKIQVVLSGPKGRVVRAREGFYPE